MPTPPGNGPPAPARPLAGDRERFGALHARAPAGAYERAADAMLPARRPSSCAARCPRCGRSADAPAGTRMLWAQAASGDYPVFAGAALLETGFFPVAGRRASA